MGNSISSKQILEGNTPKLNSIIGSKCLDYGMEMNNDHLKKCGEDNQGLGLMGDLTSPGYPSIIIYNGDNKSRISMAFMSIRSPQIHMNRLKKCMSVNGGREER